MMELVGERANSRGHRSGPIRRGIDKRFRELWELGSPAHEIADVLNISESSVWKTAERLDLPRRRGTGCYGHRQQRPGLNIARVDTAVRAFHKPVTVDEADLPDGTTGFIVFIGDKPGFACKSLASALKSAVAVRTEA